MIKEIDNLLKMSIEDIISSTHSLTLLKVYSKLYLNGAQPRTCEASLRKYYLEIKRNYKMKKEILKRICVPAFNGRKYIPGVFDENKKLIAGHLHIISELITDEQAEDFIKLGILSESDFIKLPYEKAVQEVEAKKEYTKKEIESIIKNGSYKKLDNLARELELITKRESKENVISLLAEFVSKM